MVCHLRTLALNAKITPIAQREFLYVFSLLVIECVFNKDPTKARAAILILIPVHQPSSCRMT